MPKRRKYHLLVYEPGSVSPSWFAANPMYWYPTLEGARKAAHEFACEHDHGIHVDVMKDSKVVEKVLPCND